MQMKLELVPVPTSDVDRAKSFYVDRLGWTVDLDVRPNDSVRIVQLTPPGSACSIVIGTGIPELTETPPGSIRGVHLVVADVREARRRLLDNGVEVSEIDAHDQGIAYAYFNDPDGNSWALQEMPWRAGDFATDEPTTKES